MHYLKDYEQIIWNNEGYYEFTSSNMTASDKEYKVGDFVIGQNFEVFKVDYKSISSYLLIKISPKNHFVFDYD
jgi:hypothetical protein